MDINTKTEFHVVCIDSWQNVTLYFLLFDNSWWEMTLAPFRPLCSREWACFVLPCERVWWAAIVFHLIKIKQWLRLGFAYMAKAGKTWRWAKRTFFVRSGNPAIVCWKEIEKKALSLVPQVQILPPNLTVGAFTLGTRAGNTVSLHSHSPCSSVNTFPRTVNSPPSPRRRDYHLPDAAFDSFGFHPA